MRLTGDAQTGGGNIFLDTKRPYQGSNKRRRITGSIKYG
jgi:hypothetical protein